MLQNDTSRWWKPPVDLVPTEPAAAGLLLWLLTAQAGWRNSKNPSQREVFTKEMGHPVNFAKTINGCPVIGLPYNSPNMNQMGDLFFISVQYKQYISTLYRQYKYTLHANRDYDYEIKRASIKSSTGVHLMVRSGFSEYEEEQLRSPACCRQENAKESGAHLKVHSCTST